MYSRGHWQQEGYRIKIGEAFVHREGEEFVVDVFDPLGAEAAYFKIQLWYNHPVHGKILHVMEAEVYTKHRRKGIASAVYSQMEELLGVSIHNEPDQQTPAAQAFWNQSNRPFGK